MGAHNVPGNPPGNSPGNPPRPPRNKAQLITVIARKLRERSRRRLSWAEFLIVINGIDVPQQELILRALSNGRDHVLGTLLIKELSQKELVDATAEATRMLADNSADLIELDKII